jgi:UDP-N-acetylmuramoylalanine--D-glutamate ligase
MQIAAKKLDFKDRRVTVMGLGRFGGGSATVRFLCARGARVTLTDLQGEQALASSLAELGDCRLHALHLGGHREEDFSNADLVVASPAVPPSDRFLEIARAARVAVTSEISLFWQLNPAPVIGVTGSNGKSTTAALVHSILEAAGKSCRLGGNIGKSLLPDVDSIQPDELVVLELSSFQLEDLDRIQASPHAAVVTNFSPNHLDRHGSLDAYRRAKQTILRWQRAGDIAVLNTDDADVSMWPTCGRRFGFGGADSGGFGAFQSAKGVTFRDEKRTHNLQIADWLTVPGQHNLNNAMAAACAAMALGVDRQSVRHGVERFCGLPHRLQLVGEAAGRKFYNDSKATTPEALQVALDAFEQPIVLLAGGYEKHVDLRPVAGGIARRASVVALMGQTAGSLNKDIQQYVDAAGDGEKRARPIRTRICRSLDDAFHWAVMNSAPGDAIVLSPGCASYDWFRNYQERGDRFTRLAQDWCGRRR